MHSSNQGRWYLLTIVVLFIALQLCASVYAQEQTVSICLTVDTTRDTTNHRPIYTVTWHPRRGEVNLADNSMTSYRLECYLVDKPEEKFVDTVWPEPDTTGGLQYAFKDCDYDKVYRIKVTGISKDGGSFEAESANLEMKSIHEPNFFQQIWEAFKGSTIFGQAAFIIIALFLVVGIFVFWFFKAWSAFRAENVFIKARKEYRHFDSYYEESKKRHGAMKEKDQEALKADPGSNPNPELEAQSIERTYAERDLMAYETIKKIKRLDPSLIREADLFRNRTLKIVSAVADWILWHISFRWLLKRPTLTFSDIPTVRILQSGFEASFNGGNISDIHNALDVRVASEISKLRERGFIDAIWGLGVTAPLLGLFGTITGLTMAFRKVQTLHIAKPDIILKQLGGGIYEALWTTFFGLLAGIILMLVYYYYNYKLERITALWEDMSANLLDILKKKKQTGS